MHGFNGSVSLLAADLLQFAQVGPSVGAREFDDETEVFVA